MKVWTVFLIVFRFPHLGGVSGRNTWTRFCRKPDDLEEENAFKESSNRK